MKEKNKKIERNGVMKVFRSLLIIMLTLTFMAGQDGIRKSNTVLAATTKTITIKAASDFTLKVPKNWKGNYIMKSSKGKKQGSYVALYPTDVQSEGATKDAKKQYSKLNKSVEKVAKSIQP